MFEQIVEGLIIMFKTFLIFIRNKFDKPSKISNNNNHNQANKFLRNKQ